MLLSVLAVTPVMGADSAPSDPSPIVSRIPREPVQSSALSRVGYSNRRQILEVEFANGAVYRYVEVPRSIYHGLMSAESKARYYHLKIKKKFRSTRVRPGEKHSSRP